MKMERLDISMRKTESVICIHKDPDCNLHENLNKKKKKEIYLETTEDFSSSRFHSKLPIFIRGIDARGLCIVGVE